MSRDKQISEMAKDLHRNRCGGCGEELCEYKIPTNDEFSCIDYKTATALYTAGYRKASDLAEEIFAEIENLITNECLVLKDEQGIDGYVKASVHYAIAKLKKKHTESDG